MAVKAFATNTTSLPKHRTSVSTVDIARICLAIRTQNEIGVCDDGKFYVWVSFEPQEMTAECNLRCQSSNLVYVLTYY